jgi:hypothetical protein
MVRLFRFETRIEPRLIGGFLVSALGPFGYKGRVDLSGHFGTASVERLAAVHFCDSCRDAEIPKLRLIWL